MDKFISYKIHPNVQIGKNFSIDDFVIIGYFPKEKADNEIKTVIGNDAVIRSHTVIYAGNIIGDEFHAGHNVLIREENNIGDLVSIGSHSVIEHHVKIGNKVRLHSNVFIPEFTILEDECWLGPNVVLTNALYPRSKRVKETLKGAIIKTGAKIGANATILAGVVIGENALVGAGAVVTKDVKPHSVVVGNPASEIKDVRELVYKDDLLQKAY